MLPFICFFLLISAVAAASQTVTINFYDSTNYERSVLFLEQDLIYGNTVTYNQGLELICLQDKVKAEIQGIGTLYTPLDLNDIPPGDYVVQLSKTGYYPHKFTIIIRSDGRSSVEVDLKPYSSLFTLEGLPEGAVVYINNQKIEGNSAEVMPGDVSLRIRAFGYDDYIQVINIGEEREQSFEPEMIRRDFALESIDSDRDTLWLGDSPSQKRFRLSLIAKSSGEGQYAIVRLADGKIVQAGSFSIDSEKTSFDFDLTERDSSAAGEYLVSVTGTDGETEVALEKPLSVRDGRKAQWRNNFTGIAGFLYCPGAETLPKGISQIQSGFNPSFTADSLDDLYIPAFLSVRTAVTDRLEIAFGTALYMSPLVDESSIDFFASGKFMILGYEGTDGFSLAAALGANYNGTAGDFGSVPAYDPYGGVSGISLSLPLQFRVSSFSFVVTPEFRIAPSYPMMVPGGFDGGELHIWNYFKGAIVLDRGIFSMALSGALQSPSYTTGSGRWPLYGGAEVVLTPGKTGFSLSLFGGVRYLSDDPLLGTAGITAGFLW